MDTLNKNTDLFGADGERFVLLDAPIALQTATVAGNIRSMLPETSDTQNEYDELSCQDLSNKFGIIAGQTFGTADEKVRNSWIRRGCNTKPSATASEETTPSPIPPPKKAPLKSKPSDDNTTEEESSDEYSESEDNNVSDDGKIFGMPKGVVIGLGISVALIGGFLIYKKMSK